jgi:hypothetical protein
MVTWDALVGGIVTLFGIGFVVYGLLALFGASMASSPGPDTDRITREGCGNVVLGLLIAIGTGIYLVLS